MEIVGVIFVGVLIGLIPARIAASKGRDFLEWWIYGAVLFIVALPHALLISPDLKALEGRALVSGGSKKCQFCAELIKRDASVCRYCGRDLPPMPSDADNRRLTALRRGEQYRRDSHVGVAVIVIGTVLAIVAVNAATR